MKTTTTNSKSKALAIVTRKSYRLPTPISTSLAANVALQLGRSESGVYDHTRFEANYQHFEADLERAVGLLEKCQARLKNQQTPEGEEQ
jgi:hypothetical protein